MYRNAQRHAADFADVFDRYSNMRAPRSANTGTAEPFPYAGTPDEHERDKFTIPAPRPGYVAGARTYPQQPTARGKRSVCVNLEAWGCARHRRTNWSPRWRYGCDATRRDVDCGAERFDEVLGAEVRSRHGRRAPRNASPQGCRRAAVAAAPAAPPCPGWTPPPT